jgi:hypothetical protein
MAESLQAAKEKTMNAWHALQTMSNRGVPYYTGSWFGSWESVDRRREEYRRELVYLRTMYFDAVTEEHTLAAKIEVAQHCFNKSQQQQQ